MPRHHRHLRIYIYIMCIHAYWAQSSFYRKETTTTIMMCDTPKFSGKLCRRTKSFHSLPSAIIGQTVLRVLIWESSLGFWIYIYISRMGMIIVTSTRIRDDLGFGGSIELVYVCVIVCDDKIEFLECKSFSTAQYFEVWFTST